MTGSALPSRAMVGAELLKLRHQRGAMLTSAALSVGVIILYLAVVAVRGEGSVNSAQVLSSGSVLLSLYFGSFTAILVGATAGTMDSAAGTFRDLVATGRSRTALFLARVPATILVAVAFNLCGYAATVAAAYLFPARTGRPSPLDVIGYGGWVVACTTALVLLTLGLASLTQSRAVTLTAVIGWQTAASTLLYTVAFLGPLRQALLTVALTHLRPGPAIGSREHPGSSSSIAGLVLPMSTAVAVVVIVAWALIPCLAGLWRTRTQDT